jgi:PAS domain S-box-containing protein
MIGRRGPRQGAGGRHRAQMFLLALCALGLLGAVLLFQWISFSTAQTLLAENMEQAALARARALEASIAALHERERGDAAFLALRFRDTLEFSEVAFVSPEALMGDPSVSDAERRRFFSERRAFAVLASDRHSVACYVAIDSPPRLLRVTFPAPVLANLSRVLDRLLWFGSTVIAVLMGILFMLLAWYGAPFSRMLDIAGRREDSPLSERTAARPPGDERAYLVSTFEAALREMRRRTEELERLSDNLVSGVASGVVTLDAGGKIVRANDAARGMLSGENGAGAPRWEERRFSDVFPSPLRDLAERALATRKTVREGHVRFRAADGAERDAAAAFFPMADAEGTFLGMLCLLTDLTRLHELEETLRARENMAHLGEMSAGIAHEFRNMLAGVAGFAQLIERAPDAGPEKIRGYAREILQETDSSKRLVDDFLRFARPVEPSRESLSALDMAEEALREARLNGEARVSVEGDRSARVEGDASMLKQAVLNLVRNALDAAADGSDPSVTVRVSGDAESVRIAVSDRGRGMDAETRRKAFLPFFTTKADGTGLGLALVRKIVLVHDGDVRIESAPGQGATVEILLPAKRGGGEGA